mgnify:CR=1 FL=1
MSKSHDQDMLPQYATDLVDDLNEQFPHRCPDPKMTEREIWVYAGKRALVDHLLSRKQHTETNEFADAMKYTG